MGVSLLVGLLSFLYSCHGLPVSLFPSIIKKEYQDHQCTSTLYSKFPSWLNGIFVRQTCGGFGNQAGQREDEKILHSFDCLGMVATFKISSHGEFLFSNRLYNTHGYKVSESFQFDFSASKIAWPTVFSPYDATLAEKFSGNWTENEGYYTSTANVNFWRMTSRSDGGKFITEAVDESPHGLGFDVRDLTLLGPYQFEDDFEKQPGTILIDTPAHGAIDAQGIRWGTTGIYTFTSSSTLTVSVALWKIADNARKVQGIYKIGANVDLALCRGDYKTLYPNLSDLQGYMHSFVMTENYVVLPQTSLVWNPCGIFMPRPRGTISNFDAMTTYLSDKPSRFFVFDKKTMQFVADVEGPPTFISHQANWFEEGNNIVADMFTYEYNIYDNLFVDDLLTDFKGKRHDNKFERFVIDTKQWKVTTKEFSMPYAAKEFPHINPLFEYKPYTYVYMLSDYFGTNSTVVKYDVQKGKVSSTWVPPVSVIPGEPVFVPAPQSEEDECDEEDGVILVGGLVIQEEVGFAAVINAKTMKTIAFARAPELTPIGLHNYFHPLN